MKKKRSARKIISNILLVLCIGVMLVSGYMIYTNLAEYKAGDDAYIDIADGLLKPPSETAEPSPTAKPSPIASGEPTEPPDDVPTLAPGEVDDGNYVDAPAPDYWPEVNFESAADINPDFVAWLSATGTNINYPVVQGSDNEYYLDHLFTGKSNKMGALFVDYRNKSNFRDLNTIIYGHNMRNHSMFWTLTRYKAQSYYNSHPTMRIMTNRGNYTLELFAGYVADPSEDAWRIYFKSGEDYLDWIANAKARSSFKSDVVIGANDHIVTLSTCSYEFNDARYIVYGKLVPQSDSAEYAMRPTPEPSPEPTPTPEPTPEVWGGIGGEESPATEEPPIDSPAPPQAETTDGGVSPSGETPSDGEPPADGEAPPPKTETPEVWAGF
ncbi:MAG: class B sortase [Oscillospiraceae bacterium]|jgi:sortase B|nr:class B sortase [Oscillospiraceae bacterium]